MARTVTFYDSATQKKIVVENVEANTLGELKAAVAGKGIDFENKSILEGVSGTSLLSDSSYLPSNICHEGVTTNDLMIYMTPRKNINSGCDESVDSNNPYLDPEMESFEIFKSIAEKLKDVVKAVYALHKRMTEYEEDEESCEDDAIRITVKKIERSGNEKKESEENKKGFSDDDIKKMLGKLGKSPEEDKRDDLLKKLSEAKCPAEFVKILFENL